ncbi:MAG: L,D-transpeptidase family protein [Acidobacteria bacterium]|nr:L,D-transpeptidase family protein [Acidobacteriota bacterium]MCB9398838.1 L,D-transpeptidase family protein [Acidobacteriota bacterium]
MPLFLLSFVHFGFQSADPLVLAERIRNRIENRAFSAYADPIFSVVVLPRFYQNRHYQPAWVDANGPRPLLQDLLSALDALYQEGLRPEDYHRDTLEELLQIWSNQGRFSGDKTGLLVDMDLLASDGFLMAGAHLLAGRIDPETIENEWNANRRDADLAEILEQALVSANLSESLQNLLPAYEGYNRLKTALSRLQSLPDPGPWVELQDPAALKPGQSNPNVLILRKRLALDGFDQDMDSSVYDETLLAAVKQFQLRHGLDPDGVIGKETRNALNISRQDRIRQLKANMERWRWLPQDLGKRYILVNIAGFDLELVVEGEQRLTSPVIVGRDYRQTPVFSGVMTYLVLNPRWNVPPKLAVEDKLPILKKDPQSLKKLGFKAYKGWGADSVEVDLVEIDWKAYSGRNFPYRLEQLPGDQNALGQIKFMFPNPYNVYLHDTPTRELFQKTERAFSSGCIRVGKPIELAIQLLDGDPAWSRASLEQVFAGGKERTVNLASPINVHLLYWTVWVDSEGELQWRKDIYGRDKRLIDALDAYAPSGAP